MAKAWAHIKMQFFYDIWKSDGAPAEYEWQPEVLAEYEEPPTVAEAYATAQLRLKQRIHELRALRPRSLCFVVRGLRIF